MLLTRPPMALPGHGGTRTERLIEWARRGGAVLPVAFFVVALLTGWLLSGLLPLGQAADEGAHAVRVDALSRGMLLGRRDGTSGGFRVPPTLLEVASVTPAGRPQTREERARAEAIAWGAPPAFLHLGTIATYFPLAYAPAAVAVLAVRTLGGTPAQAFLAGRRANLLVFALLGAAALAVARRGTALILAVLLLPMSLALAASLSGDGVLIALAALACALLTRGARGWWGGLALLAVLGLTKIPYAALLLIPLATPRLTLPVRLAAVAAASVLILGWTGYQQARVMGVDTRPAYEAGPLWPGPPQAFDRIDPAAQLRVLQSDPTRMVTLVADTLRADVWLGRQLVGVLGWLHIVLPRATYVMWAGVLLLSLAALLLEPWPPAAPAVAALVAVGTGAWAIFVAQYLGWTPVGAPLIEGVQGRYFLPLLPFLALAVPGFGVGARGAWALPLAAGVAGLATLPGVVALASFVH